MARDLGPADGDQRHRLRVTEPVGRLAVDRIVAPDVLQVLGSGFLGGYPTFSAASLATVRLVEQRRWVAALGSSIGMVLGATTAAAIGFFVGRSL